MSTKALPISAGASVVLTVEPFELAIPDDHANTPLSVIAVKGDEVEVEGHTMLGEATTYRVNQSDVRLA